MALYQTGTGLSALVGIGTTNPTSNLQVVGNVLSGNVIATVALYGVIAGANTIAGSSLTLTTQLATAYGGTGLTSFTQGGLLYASSTSVLASTGAYGTGQILYGGGTGAPGSTSTFVYSSGSVGIGTATPGYPLCVYGSNTTFQFSLQSYSTTLDFQCGTRLGITIPGWTTIDPNGSGSTGVGIWDAFAVGGWAAIGTSYAQSSTVGPTNGLIVQGNVGIGTASPGATLQVYATGTTIPLSVVTASNTAYAFTTSANQGIGTGVGATQPQMQLYHTTGGNAIYLNFFGYRHTAGTSWAGIAQRIQHTVDVTNMGYIDFNPGNATNGLAFGSGSTEFMRLVSGNVGIGTASPVTRLDVWTGTARSGTAPPSYGSIYATADAGSGTTYPPIAEFRHSNQTQGIAISFNSIYATGSNGNQSILLYSRGAAEVQVPGTGVGGSGLGNFLIDYPNSGSAGGSMTLRNSSGGNGAFASLLFEVDGSTSCTTTSVAPGSFNQANGMLYCQNLTSTYAGNGSKMGLQLWSGGAEFEAQTWLPNGNVGIGTASPGWTLTVNGGINSSYSGAGNSSYIFGVNSDYRGMFTINGPVSSSTWAANQDIGDSNRTLVIQEPTSTTASGQLVAYTMQLSPSGGSRVMLDFKLARDGASSQNPLFSITQTTGTYRDLFYLSTTKAYFPIQNVGIGTASPVCQLHLYSASTGGQVGIGQQNDSTAYFRMGMDTSWGSFDALNAYWTGSAWNYVATGGYGGLAVMTYMLSGYWSVHTASGGTNPIPWSEKMRVTNGGYVGIGTNGPQTILHAAQNCTATGDLDPSSGQFMISAADNVRRLMIGYDTSTTNGFGWIKCGNYHVTWTSLVLQPQGGYVGIGTASPAYKLHVYNGDASMTYYGPNATWGAYLVAGAGSSQIASGRAQTISTNGNLHLDAGSGQVMYLNYYNGGGAGGTGQNIQCYGVITCSSDIIAYYSDERLKTKTGSIENPLDKVCSLTAFKYVHNDIAKQNGFKGDDIQVGLSAQEVQKILPEVVTRAPFDMGTDYDVGVGNSRTGQNYLTLKYERLIPLLVEAIKEERRAREALEERIKLLEQK